jgi:hypothetical protein
VHRAWLAVACLLWFTSPSQAQTSPRLLPERPPPNGFASVNGQYGGRILAGTFTGNARSAAAALGGVIGMLRGYFDDAPAVSAAVGDPMDRSVMAFFDTRLAGAPVRGVVLVQLNEGGGGGVAIVFDHPGAIERSFSGLTRQLNGIQVPGAGPARPMPALQQQTTPDGKASIGVPPGWRITGWGNGAIDMAGPDGQIIAVGVYLPIFSQQTYGGPDPNLIYLPFIADPAAALPAVTQQQGRQQQARGGAPITNVQVIEALPTAPPTNAGRAAYLVARSLIGGRPYLHFALVNTAPLNQMSWTYYYSTVVAPQGVFERDLALMLQTWRSWSLNPQMLRDRMQEAANTMRQTGEILRSAARGQSEAFDRANRGFSNYLRSLEVLEHAPRGARGTFDRDYADAVVRTDPTKFRIVPPSQYRPG